jgi:hypothetical protein
VLPAFDLASWALRAVIVVLVIGFVPAMVFSWVFELTPEGLKHEKHVDPGESIMPHTGKQLDRMIMVALALALGYFAFDKFVLAPRREAALQQRTSEQVAEARKQGGVNALALVPWRQIDRGAAVSRHEPVQGPGILVRWHRGSAGGSPNWTRPTQVDWSRSVALT